MLNSGLNLVLATSNQGKLAEFRLKLAETSISVISLSDFSTIVEIDETGSTFAENSTLKAAGYALQTVSPTLADDSGLEISALSGRPGIHSARYGGDITFAEKMCNVLEEIRTSGSTNRQARFVSAITFADHNGNVIQTVEGICEGHLAFEPRGNGGFGYDPIFIPNGFSQTFGELTDAIKGQISHRAQAITKIMPYLRDFYSV